MNQNLDVNRLRVAKPCHMSWENMSGDERVRLCNSCDMNIYNISEMTSTEINTLIETREGRLCGRIVKRTDGTVMTKDCPPGIRGYRKKISRSAGAAFATVLALFSAGYSQKESKEENYKNAKITRVETQNEKLQVTGTIADSTGAIIPDAKIELIKQEKRKEKVKLKTRSSDEGFFKLKAVSLGVYYLKVTASGFEDFEIKKFVVNENEDINMSILLKPKGGTVVVGIFVDSSVSIDPTKSSITTIIRRDNDRIVVDNK